MQHKGLIFGIFGGVFLLAVVIAVFLSMGPGRSDSTTPTATPQNPQQPAKLNPQQEARIRQLIADLGSRDANTRATAERELLKIGAPALPLLRDAARNSGNFFLMQRASRVYRAINDVVNPPIARQVELPKPPADTSVNLLDGFGVKLGESDEGVRVVDVKKGSRAERAQLRSGDIIVSIGGRQMTSLAAVEEALSKAEPDKPLTIEVERRGEWVTLTAPPH
jgi:membrane-associated protease RseP (regulator of RpoE activity)